MAFNITFREKVLDPFFYVFYPQPCVSCGKLEDVGKEQICKGCKKILNTLLADRVCCDYLKDKLFQLMLIQEAYGLYEYTSHESVKSIIHSIKYEGNKAGAFWLGTQIAARMREEERVLPDIIVPVPLHYKKRTQRGYNQSDFIAQGVSQSLRIPVEKQLIIRKKDTKTQTQKNKQGRLENMLEVFRLIKPGAITNKLVLLVDDVITTGSTTANCVYELMKAKNVQVSLACVAFK